MRTPPSPVACSWCTQRGLGKQSNEGPPARLAALLPLGRGAFEAPTYEDENGENESTRDGSALPGKTHQRGLGQDRPGHRGKARNTPWHQDASASRSSATACPPSCRTSIPTKRGSGSTRSTTWCGP